MTQNAFEGVHSIYVLFEYTVIGAFRYFTSLTYVFRIDFFLRF